MEEAEGSIDPVTGGGKGSGKRWRACRGRQPDIDSGRRSLEIEAETVTGRGLEPSTLELEGKEAEGWSLEIGSRGREIGVGEQRASSTLPYTWGTVTVCWSLVPGGITRRLA